MDTMNTKTSTSHAGSFYSDLHPEALANIQDFLRLFVIPAQEAARNNGCQPGEAYFALSSAGERGTSSVFRDLVTSNISDFQIILEAWAKNGSRGYFNLGYRNANLGSAKRGGYEHVIGIPGLWTDIDIAGPGHKEKNLPPTLEAAIDLIREAMPTYPPTHYVTSGGGIHCYWLFKKPKLFMNAADKLDAQMMLRGVHSRIQNAAQKRGWRIDNVSDLARLLRIPGTYNMKNPENPRLVRILPWESSSGTSLSLKAISE